MTASLRTVPTVLLRLQHHATATNHRFRLVKRVRPMAFGSLPPRPESPSPPPPPPSQAARGSAFPTCLYGYSALPTRRITSPHLITNSACGRIPRSALSDGLRLIIHGVAASTGFKTQQFNGLRGGNGRGRGKCWGTQQLTSPDTTINHNKDNSQLK